MSKKPNPSAKQLLDGMMPHKEGLEGLFEDADYDDQKSIQPDLDKIVKVTQILDEVETSLKKKAEGC